MKIAILAEKLDTWRLWKHHRGNVPNCTLWTYSVHRSPKRWISSWENQRFHPSDCWHNLDCWVYFMKNLHYISLSGQIHKIADLTCSAILGELPLTFTIMKQGSVAVCGYNWPSSLYPHQFLVFLQHFSKSQWFTWTTPGEAYYLVDRSVSLPWISS